MSDKLYSLGSWSRVAAAVIILKQVRIGHAQNESIAKFRPDMPGLQLITVTFWKNPGIVTLFDHV
jgi:hypothetical protein